ncbi:hypothetical protein C3B55_00629 [Candidatus Pseudomonas adelgestsugas]|uniref:Uncharacterized protein n=1 Tax=Candidatus Pseudomonas adelgestsugas TaxID=1302376 RepID=A0ABX5R9I4_9PSED|nr:hypothetical protein C3B55_00629 [Candidatus Pseudomonas adelgestsugas]
MMPIKYSFFIFFVEVFTSAIELLIAALIQSIFQIGLSFSS